MAGISLPSCAGGVNARWKSCAFCWAKDGALVVAATATGFNGVADEYRLMVGRFDGGDPTVSPDVQTLVNTGVTYVSLDVRPDGTLDLFYFVDRNQVWYRSSRDSGATWGTATQLSIGTPTGTIENADLDTQEISIQKLRHCYSPEHGLIFAGYWYIPGTTYVQDAGWGTFSAPPIAPRWAVIGGSPDGSGGITWSTPIGIASFNLPNSNALAAFQPLPQGVVAVHGWGMWAEGITSAFTIKRQRAPTTFGTNYPFESRGNPVGGWWDMKANVLVGAFWADPLHVAGAAGLGFLAYRLNDSVGMAGGRLADPPSISTYEPPGGTGASGAAYLRGNTDGRFWLLRQDPSTGELGFLRLEKIGASASGSWV